MSDNEKDSFDDEVNDEEYVSSETTTEKTTTDNSEGLLQANKELFFGGTLVLVVLGFAIGVALSGGYVDDLMQPDPDFDFEEGYSIDGIEANNATQTHNKVLSEATYTIDFQSDTVQDGENLESSRQYAYDGESAYTEDSLINGQQVSRYEDFNNNVMYTQATENGSTTYDQTELEELTPPYTAKQYIFERLSVANTEYSGVEEADGEKVVVYDITGANQNSSAVQQRGDEFEVSGEIHVAEDGYIKQFSFDLEDANATSEQELTVSGYNDTTTSSPDWLSEFDN